MMTLGSTIGILLAIEKLAPSLYTSPAATGEDPVHLTTPLNPALSVLVYLYQILLILSTTRVNKSWAFKAQELMTFAPGPSKKKNDAFFKRTMRFWFGFEIIFMLLSGTFTAAWGYQSSGVLTLLFTPPALIISFYCKSRISRVLRAAIQTETEIRNATRATKESKSFKKKSQIQQSLIAGLSLIEKTWRYFATGTALYLLSLLLYYSIDLGGQQTLSVAQSTGIWLSVNGLFLGLTIWTLGSVFYEQTTQNNLLRRESSKQKKKTTQGTKTTPSASFPMSSANQPSSATPSSVQSGKEV